MRGGYAGREGERVVGIEVERGSGGERVVEHDEREREKKRERKRENRVAMVYNSIYHLRILCSILVYCKEMSPLLSCVTLLHLTVFFHLFLPLSHESYNIFLYLSCPHYRHSRLYPPLLPLPPPSLSPPPPPPPCLCSPRRNSISS